MCWRQTRAFAKITTVISKPLLASFEVAYRTAKCKKEKNFHLTGGSLALLAAVDTVETMLSESHSTESRKIQLAGNMWEEE